VLVKPVDGQHLRQALRRHLGVVLPETPAESGLPADVAAPTATAADDGELPTVDLELGTRLAGGRAALARELLERLAAGLPESEAAIRAALDDGDDEALLDAIHALNGACRYCGAPRLGLIAESLETRLRTRGRDAVTALMDDLFAAMAELIAWAEGEARPPGAQPSSSQPSSSQPSSSQPSSTQPSNTTNATARDSSSLIDR
ncbi:Hpt domain-containing protein, partial [Halomonas sp. BM-2019]|uniref:Hpt domain-containing protein n=1 Tax=Halomonas sp. BM-2019 TaxID=2811227 RepID=UPI0031FBD804